MTDLQELKFETLAKGGALERVNDEIGRLVENIADPNTDPERKRKVVVTITVAPDAKRSYAVVDVEVSAKLAPPQAVGAAVFLSQTRDRMKAFENTQQDGELPFEGPRVTTFRPAGGEA